MNKIAVLLLAATALLAACTSKNAGDKNDTLNNERNLVSAPKISAPDKPIVLQDRKPGAMYDGDTVERYANGVIKIKGTMGGGKRQGQWVAFFPDGSIQSECGYRDNKAHGITVTYRPNGTKIWSGFYNMGVSVGKWKYYDEQGKFIEKDYKGELPK